MGRRKNPWEKEWAILLKKEAKYKSKRQDGPTSELLMKLDKIIPNKLRGVLNAAFFKAFKVIFEKGSFLIEKTYNKRRKEASFKVNTYASELILDHKAARKFIKAAKSSKNLNMFIALIQGIGMGLLGMAIPDIAIFMAVVLKSVYEIALSYGYDYHNEEEKILILKIIEVAMTDDTEFAEKDNEVNEAIEYIVSNGDTCEGFNISLEDQMKSTSDSLTSEMLYTKFIQQFMIVGVFGGIFDPVYVNRISAYAELKYRRRFLAKKIEDVNGQED